MYNNSAYSIWWSKLGVSSFSVSLSTLNSCEDIGNRFLNSPFWIKFKSLSEWDYIAFSIESNNERFDVYVLFRTIAKNFSIVYIPMIKLICDEQVGEVCDFLVEFANKIKQFLPKHTICIRYDLPIDFLTCQERDLFITEIKNKSKKEHLFIHKANVDIQPPDTVILDLSNSLDNIMSSMKSKWRYNIHLAFKKGVIIKKYLPQDKEISNALDIFYELYKTTANRDGIAIHSKQYYKKLIDLSAKEREKVNAPLVSIYIASNENDNLAAIITLFSKYEAVYLYGASSNIKRNLMPAYLLQWSAIKDAKSYGSKFYDFYGIPPTSDKTHPMFGLYLFKSGFGGKIIHRPGSIDVPISKLYNVYIFLENVRAFYHKKIKKLFVGRSK